MLPTLCSQCSSTGSGSDYPTEYYQWSRPRVSVLLKFWSSSNEFLKCSLVYSVQTGSKTRCDASISMRNNEFNNKFKVISQMKYTSSLYLIPQSIAQYSMDVQWSALAKHQPNISHQHRHHHIKPSLAHSFHFLFDIYMFFCINNYICNESTVSNLFLPIQPNITQSNLIPILFSFHFVNKYCSHESKSQAWPDQYVMYYVVFSLYNTVSMFVLVFPVSQLRVISHNDTQLSCIDVILHQLASVLNFINTRNRQRLLNRRNLTYLCSFLRESTLFSRESTFFK